MKTTDQGWKFRQAVTFRKSAAICVGLLAAAVLTTAGIRNAKADEIIVAATAEGDAQYAWNTKYGPYGYTTGGTTLGVGLYFGAPYGNDYTMGIVEIPISLLRSGTLTNAMLEVYSDGFGTGYYYGSAGMRWLDVGATPVTGNPETDGLGPLLGGTSVEYVLWDSDTGQGAGWFAFNVTAHVQADLDAGRDFSTFVVNASRDTYGDIRAAEYGNNYGPMIRATVVPEPATGALLLGAGAAFLLARRRRKA